VIAVGLPHHVTQRGNGRRAVFHIEQDRIVYLQLLHEYGERYAVRWWGYCLMSNHVHLVAVPMKENALANALRRAHSDYARYANVKLRTSGHFWQSLLLVSSGPDSPMDGARLCGTKSASGNGDPSGGLRLVKRPNALVRRCIRISGFDAMAAMLFTGTMARHPGDRRRRGGGTRTNSRSDTHRKATWQPRLHSRCRAENRAFPGAAESRPPPERRPGQSRSCLLLMNRNGK
jgi:REP element-mobilizing transposase RayT